MKQGLMTALALIVACGLTACGGDADDHDHDHDHDDPAAHDQRSHEDAHAHAGERFDLGAVEIAGMDAQVTQIDALQPGEEATFEIRISDRARIAAVRAWVGNEQAVGSVKALAPHRRGFYDADLEVPGDLPPDSRLWIEIETTEGDLSTGSLAPR